MLSDVSHPLETIRPTTILPQDSSEVQFMMATAAVEMKLYLSLRQQSILYKSTFIRYFFKTQHTDFVSLRDPGK